MPCRHWYYDAIDIIAIDSYTAITYFIITAIIDDCHYYHYTLYCH